MANQKEIIRCRLADIWDAELGDEIGSLLTYFNGNPMFDENGNALDQEGNLFAAEGLGV
jgi:hypothetical protein